ncbi:ferric reduction oxidase 3, mitochondrial isoform X2 [Arabidopsis lyrata subsp. lyrata]|uniref:ferric reduction oxidase 3, mitochondrial isoform X2 n=1 Tax=Arabidopsis lyrata subsp. lyrata TaxID=81972 RepID=UPI000A29CBD1|nr:ferric reduction oxidase 3, mitochondrial isoform X2 [Arabidopsis lyrata subsp. lyrata]|eukprot:XP_020867678.1 ferric reduction oxidase 3, mitochondrial isoform X2 [Arabidopsis lyrata subsp. lyrata]
MVARGWLVVARGNRSFSSLIRKYSLKREMNKKVIKNVINLLTMVILMGTVVIWIMMPTSTYKKIWLKSMRAKLGKSIYFGKPGVNLLVYMFPMILLAFLGSIHLHLKKQTTVNQFNSGVERKKRDKFGALKRPMLVKGLGIVTVTEVMFLTMFMSLLLWSLANYFYYTFVTITPQTIPIDGHNLWQARLDSIAVRLGLTGNICLGFLFYPVSRGSSLLAAVGLTSESSTRYHIWLGHLVMTLLTSHGLCYCIYWISTNQVSQMLEWDRTGISHLAGEITLVAGLVMWATTFPAIRRRFFEVFFYTHYLYIVFMLFFVFHVGISYALISFPGFYIFIVDRFLRFLQSRNNVKLVSARVLPCETVELNFSKSPMLMYSPTSILFVNIPSISKLQWHPFTIISSSKLEPKKLSVMIKSQGKWSTKLNHMLAYSDQIDHLAVSVEGPYGPASTDYLRHQSLVMVSGGSGITPFISIIRDLLYVSSTSACKIPKITLICAFKTSSDLSMLNLILPVSTEISSYVDIQIKAFVTRDKVSTCNMNIIKTLCFKPHSSDQPISPILGPNSWLWLATILSSSFVIFIIIIAIISRYHIYPIDQSSKKYTSAYTSLIYLLAISISVVATSTVAMLCNKKSYYNKKDQNIDDLLSLLMIESSPGQLLPKFTNIHYGERPNLNKLLVGLKGSSVGVLVCGPRKMREEVAKICSFGSAENLQFESISFSW